MHLETGYGKFSSPSGHYHIENSGGVHRLHNYDCLYINDTHPYSSPGAYVWRTFTGGHPGPTPEPSKKYGFKWVLYDKRIRDRYLTK